MKTSYSLLPAGLLLAARAHAQTDLLVGNLPGPTNAPPAQQQNYGNGVFQGNLLMGSNAWPAAVGASGSDAILTGTTWFYNQLILSNPTMTWSFYNHPSNGTLQLLPGYDPSKGIFFQSTGDVTFSRTVSIGTPANLMGTGLPGISNLTLAVGGKLGARSVHVVALGQPWPDYVFKKAYRLAPLPEVARFVRANRHLPGMLSAATVQAEGLDLGRMDALLLQKVEELTLYLIEVKQDNEALKERVRKLEQ